MIVQLRPSLSFDPMVLSQSPLSSLRIGDPKIFSALTAQERARLLQEQSAWDASEEGKVAKEKEKEKEKEKQKEPERTWHWPWEAPRK